jgi:hypothetical protein
LMRSGLICFMTQTASMTSRTPAGGLFIAFTSPMSLQTQNQRDREKETERDREAETERERERERERETW